jgi:hypothetical protein
MQKGAFKKRREREREREGREGGKEGGREGRKEQSHCCEAELARVTWLSLGGGGTLRPCAALSITLKKASQLH